ncbi:MAG TPA: hypothetical protein VLV82_06195 [Candidatus Angelobacter sp.]|nr:hypothetical protein [Candidatus Angelobacter sp.]
MTEPWTAKHRDQLLTRVSRATVLSGALALVATAGVSYGLAGATTAATVASAPATASSRSSTGATSTAGGTTSSTGTSAATSSSTAVSTPVTASSAVPVAASGGS